MDGKLIRYRFEATFSYYYWSCIVLARDKREAVNIAFKEFNIPSGASFSIEVLPG